MLNLTKRILYIGTHCGPFRKDYLDITKLSHNLKNCTMLAKMYANSKINFTVSDIKITAPCDFISDINGSSNIGKY
jgi:hypothetical protein